MRHDHNQKFEIWEVARAASAAPGYFNGFCKKEPWTYWDGGLHHNNPAWIALEEAHRLWPSSFARNPDILLSVGSGHTNVAPVDLPLETTQAWYEIWKWQPQSLKAIAVLKNALLQAIDSERQWEQRFHGLVFKEPQHYDRLNPVLRCNPVPELDDTSALADGKLDNEADLFLHNPPTRTHLNNVVKRLIASSFYFCPSRTFEEDASGEITIQGASCNSKFNIALSPNIRSRLRQVSLHENRPDRRLRQLLRSAPSVHEVATAYLQVHILSPGPRPG